MSKRPVSLEDLFRPDLVGDTQISPRGDRIAYTVKRVDVEQNRAFTRIWMAEVGSGQAAPFTADDRADGGMVWSPDGSTLAFLSDRAKPKSQIFVIPATGGEARALTDLEEGSVQSLAWSPDGTKIAFLFRATPEALTAKATEERKAKSLSSSVRVHRALFYRLDGFGYWDEAFWQIRVADVATGETVAITDEPYHHGAPTWSADGQSLYFVANRRDDADLEILLDEIWRVPATGGEISRIEAPAGPKGALAPSPDGRWLAYIGHMDTTDVWGGRNDHVLLLPSGGAAKVRDLTADCDLTAGYLTLSDWHEGGGRSLQWLPDSTGLLFPISSHGDTRLYSVQIDGSALTPLTPAEREVTCFSIAADGTVAANIGSATALNNAWVLSASAPPRQVTHHNSGFLDEVDLQEPGEFEIANGDGGHVHGWVIYPPAAEPGAPLPCVLYVHGGPCLQYGGRAAAFHELQWLAASGYVVVFCNPRGSKGYGEAHTRAIHRSWGDRDWHDIQVVADHAASLPGVDPSRMAIMGGSYGGYMTAWAIGHTGRFACAIADRLVANMHSMSGTCDFPWMHGLEFDGNAWDEPASLWALSPLAYAGAITTPLLLIHSDGDLRCPAEQAEQLFAALRHQRKTVEYVRYPAETSHGMSRGGPPDLRADRLRRNLAWLDRWLKPSG